jgi:hypothetical protein
MSELIDKINRLEIGGSFTIGSDTEQAKIWRHVEGVFIRNLGSPTETFVNGVKITGSIRLKGGDRIKLGSTEWGLPASVLPPQPTIAPPPPAPKVPGTHCIAVSHGGPFLFDLMVLLIMAIVFLSLAFAVLRIVLVGHSVPIVRRTLTRFRSVFVRQ